MTTDRVTGSLSELAATMGVITRYADYLQRPVDISATAVRRALAAMGVDARDDAAARNALDRHRAQVRQQVVAPCTVVTTGASTIPLSAAADRVTLTTEDGASIDLAHAASPRGDGEVTLPPDLPTGYHRLAVTAGDDLHSGHLISAPPACPLPLTQPGFGWMVQLYAVRSLQSWGMGDYHDLATLAGWSARVGAAMVLVNPLHASAPTLPQEPSPYSPTSRRFRNLGYLRLEDLPEYARLDAADRARVGALAAAAREASRERIDHNAVFRAKATALDIISTVPRDDAREAAYRAWRAGEEPGVTDFATFCALAEKHGTPWQDWPAPLQHPAGDAVIRARTQLADRVEFHRWAQWLCDTQLAAAQRTGKDAGMPVGIIHDLAVGVDPGGADAWALQDELAADVTVGAPPDGFNQRGQDWGLPPLLPHRLPATGYAPFRDMLRSALRHAGGIRIDHIMGLWRLWWVPRDGAPDGGAYVQYPARDLLAVLTLEATRAGAMVVGEDLGTVEPGVRDQMAERRILSSRVMYFERVDDTDPASPMRPAAQYPRLALTSITTHDLPTAAGWWADEEIRVQTDLNLFGAATTPAAQAERKARERADMLHLLRSEGLVGEDPNDDELAFALHAFLARTPSLLVATGLGDAVGDRRQPNMPGTVDEYPNWRLPLARSAGGEPRPVSLEEVLADPRVRATAAALADRTASTARGR